MNKPVHPRKSYQSFIFTHIPKCGGTSFREYIYDAAMASHIAEDHIFVPGKNGISPEKNIIGLSDEELRKVQTKEIKVLACHARFGVHRQYGLNMQNPAYYTILREPVSRAISHYYHFLYKSRSSNYKGDSRKFKQMALQALDRTALEEALRDSANLQTKYIANPPKPVRRGLKRDAIDKAKRVLKNQYLCFGILEHIGASVSLLKSYTAGWLTLENALPHENRNRDSIRQDDALPEDLLDMIRYYNQADIELYHFALDLFHLRCKRRSIQL